MIYSKDLDFFLDKPCTIIVPNINWNYKVENMIDYFSGIIYRIDEKYIWTKHFTTGCLNCIDLSSVISISQEQILTEKNPEDKKIIEDYRTQNPEIANKTKIDNKFVNIKNLTSLIQKTKDVK